MVPHILNEQEIYFDNKTIKMENKKKQTDISTSSIDTTPKAIGIGGIFFYSDNPEETKE
jgi:hypothetical protein